MRLQDQFNGIKLASITGTIHISYFITLTIMTVDPLSCQSYIDAIELLWWVHLLMAPFTLLSFLFKRYAYALDVVMSFVLTCFYQAVIFYTQNIYFSEPTCRDSGTAVSKWLAIEIVTFYAFIGSAMLFLIVSPLFIKKPLLKKSMMKDLVDYYYEQIQNLATFLSVFAVAGMLLYIERDS